MISNNNIKSATNVVLEGRKMMLHKKYLTLSNTIYPCKMMTRMNIILVQSVKRTTC